MTSGRACCRCGPTWRRTRCPTTTPRRSSRRVKIAYPVKADRLLGGGTTPTLRLQRALGTPGGFKAWEKLLVWSHWFWFAFPHGTVLYLIFRHPERFQSGAARIYATFDIGLLGYWAVPTAPPWYASAEGYMDDGRTPELRRMMVEYGEHFWRSGWAPLYGVLGGNPLAAMPSLHFATSVSAAHVLAETGLVAGSLGWTYTLLLGPRARLPRRALRRRPGGRPRAGRGRARRRAGRVAARAAALRGVQALEVRARA